ncbi:CTD kinase subunit gamma CTK3-domain-containing protein [Pisolithus orientalis]|uniref:CTD kinase subunit gamma CTK3-domain-containing protein n=1 Tax=Pisolithus orientalis TaxID=936130 RepID=UPI0022251C5E|nr:CTD kinase subunit gamma CTK3-domain-containing protein [Pisolithus orientalis]KAI5987347.1 CTD kinase subunit gamma CTK3-domain-containing protein [Pisolithus orientalis]
MDPFEVRMQFLGLLRKLSATQQSIQKVVSYALKYFAKCGEDLWECIMEECQKGSINHRVNILYFLDSLCETSLLAKSHQPQPVESSSQAKQANHAFYVDYVARDLAQIVECVVPVGRQGLPNLTSTKQILQNWRTKRVIDPQKVDQVMQILITRQSQATVASGTGSTATNKNAEAHLSRGDIVKRMEEDRERHKRLREKRWVQTQAQSSTVPGHAIAYNPYGLASFLPLSDAENAEVALDIEFENEWETTSDWNEDDVEVVMEERELCYPHLRRKGSGGMGSVDEGGGEEPMDLS